MARSRPIPYENIDMDTTDTRQHYENIPETELRTHFNETLDLKPRLQRSPRRHPSWRESLTRPLELVLAVGQLAEDSCHCHVTRTRSRTASISLERRRQTSMRNSSKKSLDDVDGRLSESSSRRRKSSLTTPIVDAFLRLTFLKVLLVDIGISLGDFIMDFVQSINLTLTPTTINPVSFPFGVFLITSCWIPGLVVPLHLGLTQYYTYLRKRGIIESLILVVLFFGFFPLIPTLSYFCLLLTPRSTREERRRYREVERRAHEIKSISSSIEAPIQLVTLLYLMLRGILTLPWSEPLSASCVEDSLGRVACLPSIPMASVVFSILSIIKSMFDLNVYPLLTTQMCSLESLKTSFQLFLRYMPFSISNALFRICSYAFILVYLDYWSVIPGIILLLINLVIFGVSFTRFSGLHTAAGSPVEERELTGFSTAHFAQGPASAHAQSRDEGVRGSSPRSYKCQEAAFSHNVLCLTEATPTTEQSPALPALHRSESGRRKMFNRYMSVVGSIRSEATSTPSVINEENTSIFFNAISGMFFPSCHSHIRSFSSPISSSVYEDEDNQDIGALLLWQRGILQRQVYIFNPVLLLVVILVWVLVAFTSTFNYNSNILDPFWFSVAFSFLVISGLITIVLASELKHSTEAMLSGLVPAACRDTSQPDSSSHALPPSSPQSVRSGVEAKEKEEAEDRYSVGRKVAICCLLTLVIIIPAVAAILISKNVRVEKPLIFIVEEKENLAQVQLGILSAFAVFPPREPSLRISGVLEPACQWDPGRNLRGRIFVLNMTNPKCRILLQRDGFFSLAHRSNVSAVLVLDNTPRHSWRVSSYYDFRTELMVASASNRTSSEELYLPGSEQIAYPPTLMVREPDWSRYGEFLSSNRSRLSILWTEGNLAKLDSLFSCSSRPQIKLGEGSGTCRAGKHLYINGSISEKICVQGECWLYGSKCPSSYYSQFSEFSLELQCDAADLENLPLKFVRDTDEVLRHSVLELSAPQGVREEYCCRGAQHNFTLLAVEGDGCFDRWRDVNEWTRRCNWSSWIRGACLSGLVQVSRLCLVEGSVCLIREYFTTACSSSQPLQLCKTNERKC